MGEWRGRWRSALTSRRAGLAPTVPDAVEVLILAGWKELDAGQIAEALACKPQLHGCGCCARKRAELGGGGGAVGHRGAGHRRPSRVASYWERLGLGAHFRVGAVADAAFAIRQPLVRSLHKGRKVVDSR